MKVMLLGDIHGEARLMRAFLDSPIDTCIQLGDFGFIWEYNDIKYNSFLNSFEKNYPNKTIYVVPGNHENYDSIVNAPLLMKNGALVRKIRENVFFIERGEVLSLGKSNFLCLGGANSTDKDLRLMDNRKKTWWKEEAITEYQLNKTLLNFSKNEIDFILTHDAPAPILYKIFYNPFLLDSELKLNELYKRVNFEEKDILWFCAHLHTSWTDGCITVLNCGEPQVLDV